MTKNRVLICTFLALTSGFFAGFVGWQISMHLRSQKCQNQVWGVRELCSATVTPGAIWSGSTTGLWTGTILGAFVGGLATKKR
ncbi:MAG: hypothetical protein IGS39_10960 [Calothrix sp. C42_A2020_038]|nr:hypothetical protein [Calothrix sp. C42_A2020_038]